MAVTTEHISHADEFAEHKRTYHAVLRMVAIGTIHALTILVALAIGSLSQSWHAAAVWMIAATIAVAVGASSARLSWRPGAVVLGLTLFTLAVATG